MFNKKSAEEKMIDSMVKALGYKRETIIQALANIRASGQQMTSGNLAIECGLIESKGVQFKNNLTFRNY